jgi:hypothetical protein
LVNPDKLISTRWNPSGINVDYTVAGEYGTMDSNGKVITPSSNIVTFAKKGTKLETILDASALTTYSIENVLGADFAATAQAATAQAAAPKASLEGNTITITPANGGDAGVYLIEKDGEFLALTSETTYSLEDEAEGNKLTAEPVYTVRASNAKGGFGEPAIVSQETAVEIIEAAAEKAQAAEGAFVIDGKIVIVKDGKQFTAAGARIK